MPNLTPKSMDLLISLPSLIKPLSLVATGVMIFAIVLGHFSPPLLDVRLPGTEPLLFVPAHPAATGNSGPLFFDPDTGRRVLTGATLPDQLCVATTAPWRTEERGTEFIGHLIDRKIRSDGRSGVRSNLALIALGTGKVLRRIPLPEDVATPSGSFCWLPGLSRRAHFSGSDGKLYLCDFEDERAPVEIARAVPRVRRLSWATDRPGGSSSTLQDPSRASDGRLAGFLFVSVRIDSRKQGGTTRPEHEIWWLRTDRDGGVVVDAGRLTRFDVAEDLTKGREIRFPVLGGDKSGNLILSSMHHDLGRKGWMLQVNPIVLDERSGLPLARAEGARSLAGELVAVQPAFSSDGQWISGVSRDTDHQTRVRRFALEPESRGASVAIEVD